MTNDNSDNNEQNQTIGEILNSARLQKGLELEKIVDEIKIKKRFLEQMEANEFQALPSLITARGFMRVYGQYLNINVQELCRKFDEIYPGQTTSGGGTGRPDNTQQVEFEVNKRDFFSTGLKSMNRHNYSISSISRFKHNQKFTIKSPLGYIVIGILALIISSWYFSMTMSGMKTDIRQASDVKKLEAKLTPEALKNINIDKNKVYINALANNKTFVSTIIDGRLVFQGMLDKHDAKTWEGEQYIKIKASAPRNLELYVNGISTGVLAEQLTPAEKTFFPLSSQNTQNLVEKTKTPSQPVVKVDAQKTAPAKVVKPVEKKIEEPKAETKVEATETKESFSDIGF